MDVNFFINTVLNDLIDAHVYSMTIVFKILSCAKQLVFDKIAFST